MGRYRLNLHFGGKNVTLTPNSYCTFASSFWNFWLLFGNFSQKSGKMSRWYASVDEESGKFRRLLWYTFYKMHIAFVKKLMSKNQEFVHNFAGNDVWEFQSISWIFRIFFIGDFWNSVLKVEFFSPKLPVVVIKTAYFNPWYIRMTNWMDMKNANKLHEFDEIKKQTRRLRDLLDRKNYKYKYWIGSSR